MPPGSIRIRRVIDGKRRQAFATQAIFIFPAQFFPRPWSKFYLETPAAFEGRSAAKWISAGLTQAMHPSLRLDELYQFAQHHHALENGFPPRASSRSLESTPARSSSVRPNNHSKS